MYASGPAGEPYPSLPVSVKLNHLYSTSTFQFSLETDEKGEVSLEYHPNRCEWQFVSRARMKLNVCNLVWQGWMVMF